MAVNDPFCRSARLHPKGRFQSSTVILLQLSQLRVIGRTRKFGARRVSTQSSLKLTFALAAAVRKAIPTAARGRWRRKAALARKVQLIHRPLSANIGNCGSRPEAVFRHDAYRVRFAWISGHTCNRRNAIRPAHRALVGLARDDKQRGAAPASCWSWLMSRGRESCFGKRGVPEQQA
jgi:hypothetical protein